ncbi:helix-turn-helix domain-containing protein [Abyssicoccus albus]|uniref:helix-turn-helix domain-containing protein n=1 Tax=Abyssicoccus albus TaxID=1817405 RepID=UPI00097E1BC8|nr:helix-turn-helix domain-containing protein [Abyssicoccus albus]AQL56666.1 hypothetical protein BVH56_06915 [Abyssicoccus albus]
MALYDELEKGLVELNQHAQKQKKLRTKKVQVKVLPEYNHIDIKEIRNRKGYSQKTFSEILGVSIKTVEAWEKGTNKPNGPSRRLLQVFDNHSEMIEKEMILSD